MTRSSDGIELTLFSKPQLLITESAEDFAVLVWEILRLRRCKVAIVNTAFKNAVSHTVYHLAGRPQVGTPERDWYEAIVVDWFSKAKARNEVLQLLSRFHLDESAIEAEAIRSVFSELEVLDKMLTLLESRRNKALRSIADYRGGFVKQVREVSNRVIEADAVIQLENQAARRSA